MSADNYILVDYRDCQWWVADCSASCDYEGEGLLLPWRTIPANTVEFVEQYIASFYIIEYGVRWSDAAIAQSRHEKGIIHTTRDELIKKLTGKLLFLSDDARPPIVTTNSMAIQIAMILEQ